MENTRQSRVLEIFFRGLRGEDLSVQHLADEYGVSTKSITRSINDLKAFLADHRELVGETELRYSHQDKMKTGAIRFSYLTGNCRCALALSGILRRGHPARRYTA